MQFQFAFKHMDRSESVADYAEKKIAEKIQKFVTKPIEAHVTFAVDKHQHIAHCNLVGGDGFNIQVENTSPDMYGSIDKMIDKLEAQLKRHKEKLKEHRSKGKSTHLVALEGGRNEDWADAVDAADVIKYEAARKRVKG